MLEYPGPHAAATPLQGAKMFRGCQHGGLHLGAKTQRSTGGYGRGPAEARAQISAAVPQVDPDIVVPGLSESYLDFQPPNTATYIRHQKTGAISYLSLTATPTLPGMCRSFINTTVVYPEGQEAKNRSVPLVLKLLPKFHRHLNFLRFLFMDHVFLHGQEKILVQQGYDVNSKVPPCCPRSCSSLIPPIPDDPRDVERLWDSEH